MAAVSLLLVVPTAVADSFSFSVSGSTQINFMSPDDNYWGVYETYVDGPGTASEVAIEAPFVNGELSLAGLSFSLPAGSTITSASMELVLPTTAVEGSFVATNVTSEQLPQPNPDDPTHIAPTFVNPQPVSVNPFEFVNGIGRYTDGVFHLTDAPVVSGNQISTGDLSLELTGASAFMEAVVATQGFNYAGYVDATGQANLPYTLEVVGTYTPPAAAPEPSGMVLLGTGVLALMAGAWWRRAAAC
jgi:hypothetical protein